MLNSATCHDGSLGSGSIAPHILDISTGERWMVSFILLLLHPHGTHSTAGEVGPRTVAEPVLSQNNLLPCWKMNLSCPDHSQLLNNWFWKNNSKHLLNYTYFFMCSQPSQLCAEDLHALGHPVTAACCGLIKQTSLFDWISGVHPSPPYCEKNVCIVRLNDRHTPIEFITITCPLHIRKSHKYIKTAHTLDFPQSPMMPCL